MTAPSSWRLLLIAFALALAAPAFAEEVTAEAAAADEAEATPGEVGAVDAPERIDLAAMEKERRIRAALFPMSPRVGRYIGAAGEALSDGDFEEALELLERINPARLNPWERANLYRLMAYVYYQTSEFLKAIEYFNLVLDEEALFVADETRIRFNIVQLYAALQDWKNVVHASHIFFLYVPQPEPLAYYLLAVAHYQLEEMDEAIAWATKAVDNAPKPNENWLQLLAALHVQKQDYDSAAPIFEELVMTFPKREYWIQLSLIYGARDDNRSSLAVQQIAYLQGFLQEDGELKRLARSYLYGSLPHEAAMVLEKGLEDGTIDAKAESYELLANSWIQAREFERSLGPLGKAAELSDDGKLYVRLGQVHMQREEWTDAIELFNKATAKGGLENPGFTQLLLGICYYNDNKINQARQAFARARKHEKTRQQADDWITHIVNETKSSS